MTKIEISSWEELEVWLESKPREVAQTLASRAALRAFPLLKDASSNHELHKTIILPMCRALYLSWFVTKYPDEEQNLYLLLDAASETAYHALRVSEDISFNTSKDINYVAYAVASTLAIISIIKADNVLSETSLIAGSSDLIVWEAISRDVSFLSSQMQDFSDWNIVCSLLSIQEVWLCEMPSWIEESCHNMFHHLEKQNENWWVWKRWYDAILQATPIVHVSSVKIKEISLAIAKLGNETWEKGPAHVNGIIAKFFEEAEKNSKFLTDNFIPELLNDENRSMSVDEIYQAICSKYPHAFRSSVRWRLINLTNEGFIKKVRRGVYASLKYQEKTDISEDDVIKIASPSVGLTEENKLTLTPNQNTDTPVASEDLKNLPLILASITRAILKSLPANSPIIVKSAFEEYLAELDARGVQPILGLLEAQGGILLGAIKDDEGEDTWLTKAQDAGLREFFKNHKKLLEHFPLRVEREDVYENVELDIEEIQKESLSPEFSLMLDEVRAAHEAGLTTDEYLKFYEKAKETAGNIDSTVKLDKPVPEIILDSDESFRPAATKEKAFFAQIFGVVKQSVKRVAFVLAFIDSPTVKKIAEALLAKFFEFASYLEKFINF